MDLMLTIYYILEILNSKSYAKLDTKNLKLHLIKDPTFTSIGLELRKLPDDSYTLDQSFYLKKIKILSDDDIRNVYASRRMMLS